MIASTERDYTIVGTIFGTIMAQFVNNHECTMRLYDLIAQLHDFYAVMCMIANKKWLYSRYIAIVVIMYAKNRLMGVPFAIFTGGVGQKNRI